jgi:hypothetical protein
MVIKEGFGGRPMAIKVTTGDHEGRASIDIDMINSYRSEQLGSEHAMDETLHYATISELIGLRDEINKAIKELAGV